MLKMAFSVSLNCELRDAKVTWISTFMDHRIVYVKNESPRIGEFKWILPRDFVTFSCFYALFCTRILLYFFFAPIFAKYGVYYYGCPVFILFFKL